MANGTKYTVKQELIDSVVAKVFKNENFAVTAEQTQKALCDMIESLWDDLIGGGVNVINTTYGDLNTDIGNETLVAGTWYRFEYENIHSVWGTTFANTETPGYTSYKEHFYVLATTNGKINGFALSEENPSDLIEYSITQTLHGISQVPDNGTIVRRSDVFAGNEAPFDLRNHIVMRQSASNSGVPDTAIVDRGDIIYDVSASIYKISVRDGSEKENFRLCPDISQFANFAIHPEPNITVVGQSLNGDGNRVYTQAFEGSNTGVKIGNFCQNIKVKDCSSVVIDNNSTKITLEGVTGSNIGKFCNDIIIKSGDVINLESKCNRVMIFSGARINLGVSNSDCYFSASSDINTQGLCVELLCLSSSKNTFKSNCVSLFMVRNADDNNFGSSCGAITLGNSVNNDFKSDCTDIEIYSGGWNRLAQGCNVINLLGELDNAHTGNNTQDDGFGQPAGTDYYSPYSEMAYNTFGVGCSNITFNILGGRGNQFGDECKNLSFTTGVSEDPWRLVGTHWVRGIQNKTFRSIIHGCSFLVPCQETQTITQSDWYAQIIHNRQVNLNKTFSFEISEDDVADATDYTINLVTLPTANTPNPPIAATYTSGVGATKASITAGLKAELSTVGGAFVSNVKTLGDKVLFDADGYKPSSTDKVYLTNQGPLDNLEGVDFPNAPTVDRIYNNSLIRVTYNADAYAGETYAKDMLENGDYDFRTADGTTYSPVGGEPLSGKAFAFTKDGYPLNMMLTAALPKPLDPTPSLNRI